MKAIILTAGKGKRLEPLTKDIPKSMLKVGGKTLIERLINTLNELGITDITLITGHGAKKVEELLGNKVKYIYNKKYDSTNNILSQWLAKDIIKENDCLIMHADILIHKDIIKRLIDHKGDICLAIQEKDKRDMIRVKMKDGLITEINKPIPFEGAFGNFIGAAKYSAKIGSMINKATEEYLKKNKLNVFYVFPINELIKKGIKIHPVLTDNLPWCDIDEKEDLKKAKEVVLNL